MAAYLELGIESLKDLFNYLSNKSKGKDILMNELMREIRDNIKLLEHRNSDGVNASAIIERLSNSAIIEAYKQNFSFNKLAHKKKLDAKLALNKSQIKYAGWDAEKFIYSIEGKIKDIKNLPLLYTDLKSAPINLQVRLDNLFYQLVLLTLFIKDSNN